jgi:hypothetical protein
MSIFNVMLLQWKLGSREATIKERMRSCSGLLMKSGLKSAFSLFVEAGFSEPQRRLALLQAATKLEPNNGDALGRLAQEYMRIGQPGRAADELQRAVPLLTEFKREAAIQDLAAALRQAGRDAEADKWDASLH